MDKIEKRRTRNLYILMLAGMLLSAVILFLDRGFGWLTSIRWSDISWLQWLAMLTLLIFSILLQYFWLLLLYYSKLRYIVIIVIPVIWLFNNGIIAMSRFLDWTTDIGATIGWLSFADLISWLAGAVYVPLLLGTGAIAAILDMHASMLSQACYYARMALDIAGVSPWAFIDFGMTIITIAWDLVANSFTQEVIKHTSDTDSLFEFSLQALLGMPGWISSTGYNLSCLSI